MATEEDCVEVRKVMDGLPEKDRKILLWLFFEERDKGEICRVLDVDREYFRVLVRRAKLRFRDSYLQRSATKIHRASPMG